MQIFQSPLFLSGLKAQSHVFNADQCRQKVSCLSQAELSTTDILRKFAPINKASFYTPETPSTSLELSAYDATDDRVASLQAGNMTEEIDSADISTLKSSELAIISNITDNQSLSPNSSLKIEKGKCNSHVILPDAKKDWNDVTKQCRNNLKNKNILDAKMSLMLSECTSSSVNSANPLEVVVKAESLDENNFFPSTFESIKQSMSNPLQNYAGSAMELSCDICHKMFCNKRNLTNHMLTHTGNKPFSCDACGKSFLYKSRLKEHMNKHTGEKPFSCNICSDSFRSRYHLKRHIQLLHKT